MKPKPTFASAIALIALFVSLGGTVYAAAKIDGKTIKKGSIPANRLKADSLGGAQVNEGALAQVPSAASVQEADRAQVAEQAASAARADLADQADFATSAARAGSASQAEHAKAADEATVAEDVERLDGVNPVVLAKTCERGTVRAAVSAFDASGDQPNVVGFNCAGGQPVVERTGARGEYNVRLDGIEAGDRGHPAFFASGPGINSAVSIFRAGEGVFRVKVYSTENEGLLPNEPFTVVFF